MASLTEELAAARECWTSDQLAVWYPPPALRRQLRKASQRQASWVGDANFGSAFRDDVGTVAVSDPLAWGNRRISLPDGHWCVTGIRFRGLDVTKPFVDLVATSLPPTAESVAGLCDVVLPEYTAFSPRAVRVDAPDPDALVTEAAAHPSFARADVDQYVVAGLVVDLRARPRAAQFDNVALAPIAVEQAAEQTALFYRQVESERPDLPAWATPSTLEDLAECADEGLLFAVQVDGAPGGVVAARRDDDHVMTGFVVQEIVLGDGYRGRRLGAPVLQRLVHELPAREGDTLWGTIHPDNQPSLRNSRSIGRQVVGGYVWITPRGFTGL